ncbi:MAG: hypothetical protein LBU28_00010 [Spirochaetaceae bacterium]|nr:hypothetical protein [Spirochaetaceae bacterium]
MKRRNRYALRQRTHLLASASLVVALLASCATGPRTSPPQGASNPAGDVNPQGAAGEFAALAPGALAYIAVDVRRSRPILDRLSLGGFSGRQAADLLDKTDSAAAAVYPPFSPRTFLIAARGSYPAFRAALSFALSSAWKRTRSPEGGFYWRSSLQGLSVALDKRRAFVSDGDPFTLPPGAEAPEPYGALRRGALLAGWSDYGGTSLNQFLASLGLPLRFPADRIIFAVHEFPAGGEPWGYQAALRIETPSVSHAKGLTALFSLARIFLARLPPEAGEGPPGQEAPSDRPLGLEDPLGLAGALAMEDLMGLAEALFANSPVQDGPALLVRTGPLDAAGIALLFSMLSLYSPYSP